MVWAQSVDRAGSVGVEPHRASAKFLGFPRIPWVDMGVQVRVAVAEDLVVDAYELRVQVGADGSDGFAETGHVLQEERALWTGEFAELVGVTVVEKDAVPGQVLIVPDDRPPASHAGEQGGVDSLAQGPQSVGPPVDDGLFHHGPPVRVGP
jgi:hypothetical protein